MDESTFFSARHFDPKHSILSMPDTAVLSPLLFDGVNIDKPGKCANKTGHRLHLFFRNDLTRGLSCDSIFDTTILGAEVPGPALSCSNNPTKITILCALKLSSVPV